jgi:hypothetical protein
MDRYAIALYAHVLVVVYLLGADVGRLYLARAGSRTDAAVPSRLTAARGALWLGSVTNAALILVLPAGVSVGGALGAYRVLGSSWLIATGLVAAGWLALSVAAERAAGRPGGGQRLALADTVARVLIGAGNVYDGAIAFAGTSATVDAPWLAGKITLYGLLIFLSIPARRAEFEIRREVALLAAVSADTGAASRLGSALAGLSLPVTAGWLLILAAAWLGVSKSL